jgi:hypothetical protein
MIVPKTATLTAVTIIVFGVFPSHTIRSGARADFGKLLRITRYGSSILESVSDSQRIIEMDNPSIMTRKKERSVS